MSAAVNHVPATFWKKCKSSEAGKLALKSRLGGSKLIGRVNFTTVRKLNVRANVSLATQQNVPLLNESVPTEPLTLQVGSKRVVLVRHGESTWNAEGRIQGSSDYSVLTAKGLNQADTSRQMLLSDKFQVCFHSPLQRSARTAEIIWGDRSQAMIPLSDLREIDLYSFQGLLKGEGKERYGDAYRTWQTDAANFEIDGHYPVRELWARARSCWEAILSHPSNSVLVVAHNAVNQALVATAAGLGPEYFRVLLQSNCGVSVLDFVQKPVPNESPVVYLNRLNQTPSPPIGMPAKCAARVMIVCTAATDSSQQGQFSSGDKEKLNMLGIVQSRKTAELLLDVKVSSVMSSPSSTALQTANEIIKVQEAAECLGADCVARFVEDVTIPQLKDVEWGSLAGTVKVDDARGEGERWIDRFRAKSLPEAECVDAFFERVGQAWQEILLNVEQLLGSDESLEESPQQHTVVVVCDRFVCAALICQKLGLTPRNLDLFHLDSSSLNVIDFPEGPSGRTIVRCLNYTAHLGRWAVPVTRPVANDEDF